MIPQLALSFSFEIQSTDFMNGSFPTFHPKATDGKFEKRFSFENFDDPLRLNVTVTMYLLLRV